MAATTSESPAQAVKVFIVQKSAASLAGYAESQAITEIVGVFSVLRDANDLVRACQREFIRDFELPEEDNTDEFDGFKTEDKGDVYDDTPPATGVQVGFYWEFDEELQGHFYSCGVKCFPLIGETKGVPTMTRHSG
jgi:hypothetical protein